MARDTFEQPVPVQRYLADEVRSSSRREYVGGFPYAMAGASNRHNQIATNTLGALVSGLRGGPCRAFNSDTKVRIRIGHEQRFYYPDALVTCSPNAEHESFQDAPAVVVEVLSPATRRIDMGEKRDAYLTIPSLSAYVVVEQDTARIFVHRRAGTEVVREEFSGMNAVVPLPAIGIDLPLDAIYDGVTFESR